MKILFLFCDMVPAKYLQSCNPNHPKLEIFDKWMQEFGGDLYANTYTPSPDTPRSLTSLFTGLYPKKHGCTTRPDWPKYFLDEKIPTFWDFLAEKNFKIIANLNNNEYQAGTLPPNFADLANSEVSFSIQDSLNNLQKNCPEDLFWYVSLKDYHWAQDDYGHNQIGHYYGQKHLIQTFKKIFKDINPDTFDHILLFSDHGHKFFKQEKLDHKLDVLNEDRSRIVLLHRKKGQTDLRTNPRFSKIMDVFPSLLEWIGINNIQETDGVALTAEDPEQFVVLEDSSTFAPYLNSTSDLWAYVNQDSYYIRSFFDELLYQKSNTGDWEKQEIKPELRSKLDQFCDIIAEKSSAYTTNINNPRLVKTAKMLTHYAKLTNLIERFSDGPKRLKQPFLRSLVSYICNRLF